MGEPRIEVSVDQVLKAIGVWERLLLGAGADCEAEFLEIPRPPEEILTRNDLAELQQRLSMMSVTAVQDFYQYTHSACRIGPGHFPNARAIQELVQAWKQMRKWQ